MSPRLVILLVVLATVPVPLHGQALGPEGSTERLVLWSVVGGAVGWTAGAVAVGGPLARWNPLGSEALDDGLWTPGIVIGFELGQALAIPLAAHVANGRQGDLQRSMAASLAIGALGTLLLWTDDFDAVFETRRRQAVLVAVPLAQIVTSIALERRRRHPR